LTDTFLLVRHGESAANVARHRAHELGAEAFDAPVRDPDSPLTDLGREQATAAGRRLAGQLDHAAVWVSPYLRTTQTAQLVLDAAGCTATARYDERLRDRELGIIAGLTWTGVKARFPDEAGRMRTLGKFYYRPPGGESWTDLALRLRSFLVDATAADTAPTALVVTHDAPIMVLRYVLEGLSEPELVELESTASPGNASISRLVRDPSRPIRRWSVSDVGGRD
jgi:broad specificity phosphatase PhoE